MSTSPATSSPLAKARSLTLPSYEETLVRSRKVSNFWFDNQDVLEEAWKEWDATEQHHLPKLDSSIFHPKLRAAVEAAWKDPSTEQNVRDLWEEVSPGVFRTQFFDPEKIHLLREMFDKASKSGVPARAPYGILLNRAGVMIDPRSVGYLAAPTFQDFYQSLMETYTRPIGRLLFPEYIQDEKDDSQTFGFSIEYKPTTEQGIRMHSDSSALTLNINMNLPDEKWEGSSLIFVDPHTGDHNKVDFGHGVAVVHRGAVMHAAMPLTAGQRNNLVLWLYGRNGYVNHYEPYAEKVSAAERWAKPDFRPVQDSWAPF